MARMTNTSFMTGVKNWVLGKIANIMALIPNQASSSNQLADKNFVNSSIATATATFRGTYNVVSDLSLSYNATHAQIEAALAMKMAELSIVADNNDYAFVQIPTTDATPTQIAKIEKYKYNGTAWAFEYELNNSGFTAAQWAAINSGATLELIGKLSALPTNAELTTILNGKASKAANATTGHFASLDANGNPTDSGISLEDNGAYDVTAHNSGAKFADLSALLSNVNLNTLIPIAVRKGGMSIKFVQSSDNKYIQARCMAQNFTTDVTQWQGVDDEPTAGSDNLVKSGGVDLNINKFLIDKGYISSNVIEDSDNYYVTPYIPYGGGSLTWNVSNVGDNVYLAIYNSSFVQVNQIKDDAAQKVRTNDPATFAYIRCSFKRNQLGSLIVNGRTVWDNSKITSYSLDKILQNCERMKQLWESGFFGGFITTLSTPIQTNGANYRYIASEDGIYSNFKDSNNNAIYANYLDVIEGVFVRGQLTSYKKVSNPVVRTGYKFGGAITPESSINISQPICYLAFPGTYTLLNNTVVPFNKVQILKCKYNTSGVLEVVSEDSHIFNSDFFNYFFVRPVRTNTTADNTAMLTTAIAYQKGTYPYFLDGSGTPITIDKPSLFSKYFINGQTRWNVTDFPFISEEIFKEYVKQHNAEYFRAIVANGFEPETKATGAVTTAVDSNYYITPYIPVSTERYLWVTSDQGYLYALGYDENFNRINQWRATNSTQQLDFRAGSIKYIRVTFKTNKVGGLYLSNENWIQGTALWINDDDFNAAVVGYQLLKSKLTPIQTLLNNVASNGYKIIGAVTSSSSPITTDVKVAYLAGSSGTYSNFNNIVVNNNELALIKQDGSIFIKESIFIANADPSLVEDAVSDWLDAHPEATTTVEDGSITLQKLQSSISTNVSRIDIGAEYGGQNIKKASVVVGGSNVNPDSAGGRNIVVGIGNLTRATSTCEKNISVGYHSQFRQWDGTQNVSMGNESMDNASHGDNNTAVGANALRVQRWSVYGGSSSDVSIEGEDVSENTCIGNDTMSIFYGNRNLAIGSGALKGQHSGTWGGEDVAEHGNNNMAIGYKAGAYQPNGNNQFYLDNLDRGSDANARSKGMIYGEFNDSPSSQKLSINVGLFKLPYLPTSDPQVQGALWNDNGVLKISSGS